MKKSAHHGSTKQPNIDWTIMLYVAADDVLANFAVESLRQLKKSVSAPAPSGASVVVAAQFAFSAGAAEQRSANEKVPSEEIKISWIFKKGDKDPSGLGLADKLAKARKTVKTKTPEMVNMPQKDTLKAFMEEVYSKYEAKHYALILWGHGPELLLQPAAGSLTSGGDSMYITPEDLRGVLESLNRPKLDIIGFDACFMSMLEMACELQGLAKYMVASQEEVPDASFPYEDLIKLFREEGKMQGNMRLDSLVKKGAEAYISAYQDCICDESTGMKPVSLSVFSLEKCTTLEGPVRSLADALLKAYMFLNAKDKAGLGDLLIEARKQSHDYAGGLYVDLHDFCAQLRERINGGPPEITRIKRECKKVLDALKVLDSNFILYKSRSESCHGISIYLPYLTNKQYADVSKPLVKGGPRTGGDKGGPRTGGDKGFSDILNGAATEYLMCARRSLILDTEKDYGGLRLATATQWYSFITNVWTNVLIKKDPAELDFHYSAQQSWMNVCRRSIGK